MEGFILWILGLLAALARTGAEQPIVNVRVPSDGPPMVLGVHPAWAAVVVAAIVGMFSVFGIVTARRSYKDNVWQTKVKVARLVYCDARLHRRVKEGNREPRYGIDTTRPAFGRRECFAKPGTPPGSIAWGPARSDLTAIHVVVRNNSEEPVGQVVLRVYDPNMVRLKMEEPVVLGTLDPDQTVSCFLYVKDGPSPATMVHYSSAHVVMSFTDSSGTHWERDATDPPKPIKRKNRQPLLA